MPSPEVELHRSERTSGRSFALPPEQMAVALRGVFDGTALLHSRSTPSEAVVALKLLYNKGHPNDQVVVNDRFDSEFSEKIKTFQRTHSLSLSTKNDEAITLVTVSPSTKEKGLFDDGVVGPRTIAALAAQAGGEFRSQLKTTTKFVAITGGLWDRSQVAAGGDIASIRDLPSMESLRDRYQITAAEERKLEEITRRIGGNDPRIPLLTFIAESDFTPWAKNKNGSASGIFQITAENAKALGTTTPAVRAMTRIAQMELYVKYKESMVGDRPIQTLGDAYALLLAPSRVGELGGATLYSKGSAGYAANPLDFNRDGRISKSEGEEFVLKRFATPRRSEAV